MVVPSADTVSKLDADVEGPDGGSGDESDHQSHVTTDSSTDSEPETTVKPVRVERKILPPPGTELWVHTKLRTRHLTFQGYIKTLFVADQLALCMSVQCLFQSSMHPFADNALTRSSWSLKDEGRCGKR